MSHVLVGLRFKVQRRLTAEHAGSSRARTSTGRSKKSWGSRRRGIAASAGGDLMPLTPPLNGVNTPWRTHRCPVYPQSMKHNKYPQDQNQKQADAPRPASLAALNAGEIDFTPAPDEVARRAYFSYVNQGSLDGHEVQHWLKAEADLIAERKLTRTHGFHNRT